MLFGPNMPWRDHPLRERVAAGLGTDLPIVVENDANAAGWAEFRFGVGRDVEDMLLLTVGTGLGGAVVVGGRLVPGRLRASPPRSATCGSCRTATCAAAASGAAGSSTPRAARSSARRARGGRPGARRAAARARPAATRSITGPSVTKAAREGDALAVELLAELGRWVGEGSASVAALLDPALVVVGGGVGRRG